MKKGLLPSQFCAGENVDNKDTCQGDSGKVSSCRWTEVELENDLGGPIQIVLKEPYCMYSIIGIVSFGKLCGFADTPGVYTNVSSYLDWIEMNTWKWGECGQWIKNGQKLWHHFLQNDSLLASTICLFDLLWICCHLNLLSKTRSVKTHLVYNIALSSFHSRAFKGFSPTE